MNSSEIRRISNNLKIFPLIYLQVSNQYLEQNILIKYTQSIDLWNLCFHRYHQQLISIIRNIIINNMSFFGLWQTQNSADFHTSLFYLLIADLLLDLHDHLPDELFQKTIHNSSQQQFLFCYISSQKQLNTSLITTLDSHFHIYPNKIKSSYKSLNQIRSVSDFRFTIQQIQAQRYILRMIEKKQLEPISIFKSAYTNVYGNQELQKETSTTPFLDYVKHYLQQIDSELFMGFVASPLCKSEITAIINKIQCPLFFSIPEYEFGSVIVLNQQFDHYSPDLYIVFPTQWQLSLSPISSQSKMFPCQTFSYDFMHICKIQNFQSSLTHIMSEIKSNLSSIKNEVFIKKNQNNKKNHHTPSWLAEALLESVRRYESKKNVGTTQTKIESKGGTLDVGIHTGITKPDTVYAVIWSLIGFIAKDNQLTEALQINYKAYLLQRYLQKNVSQTVPQLTDKIHKCLRQLRADFQLLQHHNNCYLDRKNGIKKIQTLNKYFKKSQIIETKYEYKDMGAIQQSDNIQFSAEKLKVQTDKIGKKYAELKRKSILFTNHSSIFEDLNLLATTNSQGSWDQWICVAEGAVFSLAVYELQQNQKFQFPSNSKVLESSFTFLKTYCTKMQEKIQCKNARTLSSQLHSHIQLMKSIISVVGFQLYKRDQRKTIYNADEFCVPNKIDAIYENFNSMSYLARRAAKAIKQYYISEKYKTEFFDMNKGHSNYSIYASQVSKLSKQIQEKTQNKFKKLEKQKETLKRKIITFKKQEAEYVEKISMEKSNHCSCHYEEYQVKKGRYPYQRTQTRQRFVGCSRCIRVKTLESSLENHRRKKQNYILVNFPQQNTDIHTFFEVMLKNLKNILKILSYSQVGQYSYNNASYILASDEKLEISIQPGSSKTFHYISYQPGDVDKLVVYAYEEVTIKWNSISSARYNFNQLSQTYDSISQSWKNFKQIFKDPNQPAKTEREHLIYSKMNAKPKVGIEEYIGLGSIRVGILSQIPCLLDYILSRKIRVNTENNQQIEHLQILWKSLAQLKAAADSSFYSNQIIPEISVEIINYIENFFCNYMKEWSNEDFFGLPVIGPIISLLFEIRSYSTHNTLYSDFLRSNIIKNNKVRVHSIFRQILQRIKNRFQIIQEDIASEVSISPNKYSNNCLNQAFICLGGICCFSEPILSPSDQTIEDFIELIFIFHFKISFVEFKISQYQTIKNYEHVMRLAIENNINAVIEYFKKNPKSLTKIIKKIDEGISAETSWRYNPKINEYSFVGKNSFSSYQIDLKEGVILINNSEPSSVPTEIKDSSAYQSLFGKRGFQIYKSENQCEYITRRDFSDLFTKNLGEKKARVLFSFGYDYYEQNKFYEPDGYIHGSYGTSFKNPQNYGSLSKYGISKSKNYKVVINMLIRYENTKQEERWTLLSYEQLQKLHIASLYKDNYLPWINFDRNCILLRKPKLQEMSLSGLAIFFSPQQILRAHIISKQHYQSSLDILCDQNSKYFNQLILRDPQAKKSSLAYQIFSHIEEMIFIIEYQSIDGKRKFYLHRYDMTFIQRQELGLQPESYQDYRICSEPFSGSYIPWRNKVKSLVIEKWNIHELSVSLHKKKIIIPNYNIYNTRQADSSSPNKKMAYHTYDLHDHFNRISGSNRESQLFLAANMIMISKENLVISDLNLDFIQYCIYLLQSCFNNSPLSSEQFKIIGQIQNFAKYFQSESIILICHAMLLITKQLLYLIPDSQVSFMMRLYQQKFTDQYKYFISKCMKKYEHRIKKNCLPYREIIPANICQYLGIQFTCSSNYNKTMRLKWAKQHPLDLQIEEQFSDQISQSKSILKEYSTLKQQILGNIDESIGKDNKNKKCPINLRKFAETPLITDVMNEIQQSYEAHLKDIHHTSKINIKKSNFENFSQIQGKLQDAKKKIEEVIHRIVCINKNNIDVLSKYRPSLCPFDYIAILTEGSKIYDFYPQITAPNKQKLEEILKLWMFLIVQIESSNRIKVHLESYQKIDKVTILRELQSPREEIEKKIYWVCFEVQMKLQIWISQYETFYHLMGQKLSNGSVPQLNMGEGKTQIIIPMLVLEMRYGARHELRKTPRINLLTPIFQQSKANYFRFFSITAFKIPVLELPFSREVNLLGKGSIQRIKRIFFYFRKHMILLLDQSSTHSLILKLRETSILVDGSIDINKQATVFEGVSFLDIFDEADAQMTPKKSFVYSIGKQQPLGHLNYRCLVPQILIQITCNCITLLNEKGFVMYDEAMENVKKSISNGKFPKGLRLMSTLAENQQAKTLLKKIIVNEIFSNCSEYPQLSFLEAFQNEFDSLKEYVLDDEKKLQEEIKCKLTSGALNIIYAIRGLIAQGIYEHCMMLRCTVDYGVPDEQRVLRKKKRIAVPYEASNVASKRNDFAQPDKAIFLTYLSYYNDGISFDNLKEGIKKLLSITKNNEEAKNQIYKGWYNTLSREAQIILRVENAGQIKIDSYSQIMRLYEAFRMNRSFIRFWLKNCVFSQDMGQYLNSITSSTWDHSDVPYSIGFSGTKDMHRLFPKYLKYEESVSHRIKGTDGKMIEMLLDQTLQIREIQQSETSLWKRFLETSLSFSEDYHVSCLIDVGALLAGNPLKQQIIPWLNDNPLFNKQGNFKGISFCHENKWEVYQLSNNEFVKKGTTIPDHETFVIFDEYRTRGADMKMNSNITGVISLGPNLTKDNLMQAAGRLRKIGRNQKIVFVMTSEVKQKMRKFCGYNDGLNLRQKVQRILNWTCMNSISETQKYFLENTKLATYHYKNKGIKNGEVPDINTASTELEQMYSKPMKFKSIYELSCDYFREIEGEMEEEVNIVLQSTRKFTEEIQRKSLAFDEIREREVEIVVQTQVMKQTQHAILDPIPEEDTVVPLNVKISSLKYNFDHRLKISRNFLECTKFGKYNYLKSKRDQQRNNELQSCIFVYLQPHSICMITSREVNFLIKSSQIPYYPIEGHKNDKSYIARLSDLSLKSNYLQLNNLDIAYVQCKFFNGARTFTRDEKYILKQLLVAEVRKQSNITYFLRRRGIEQYYKNSTLEKIYNELALTCNV